MKPGRLITNDVQIKEILSEAKTIAVLGLSPKPERDSYRVARYLKDQGYTIIPVRKGQKDILGETVYACLDDIHQQVDIINVFRNSNSIVPCAHEALRVTPTVFWMQLNIENKEAADLLTANGIHVVMNRCIKIEHEHLIK